VKLGLERSAGVGTHANHAQAAQDPVELRDHHLDAAHDLLWLGASVIDGHLQVVEHREDRLNCGRLSVALLLNEFLTTAILEVAQVFRLPTLGVAEPAELLLAALPRVFQGLVLGLQPIEPLSEALVVGLKADAFGSQRLTLGDCLVSLALQLVDPVLELGATLLALFLGAIFFLTTLGLGLGLGRMKGTLQSLCKVQVQIQLKLQLEPAVLLRVIEIPKLSFDLDPGCRDGLNRGDGLREEILDGEVADVVFVLRSVAWH
jgi:hypothetical protein